MATYLPPSNTNTIFNPKEYSYQDKAMSVKDVQIKLDENEAVDDATIATLNTHTTKLTDISYASSITTIANELNLTSTYTIDASSSRGSFNNIIGVNCGLNLSTANQSCYFGHESGRYNATGNQNTYLGSYCGVGVSGNNQSANTGVGYTSLIGITTGGNNSALGKNSGGVLTIGGNNTFVGKDSGFAVTTGNNNTCIGKLSGSDTSPFEITTQSNRLVLGDNSIGNAYIKVAWTVTSDERDKININDLNTESFGLEFVNLLQPKIYKFNDRSRYFDIEEDTDGNVMSKTPIPNDGSKKDSDYRIGFLAQDILQIENDLNCSNVSVVSSEDPNKLGLNETSLIPILVNAIKDLTNTVNDLKDRIEILENI